MILRLISVLTIASACAKSGTVAIHDGRGRGGATIDLTATSSSSRSFPVLVGQARLAAADRLSHRIRAERGGIIDANVRLCVAPDGRVAEVAIARSSGMPEFDRALVSGAEGWTYQPFPGASDAKVCEHFAISYIAN